MGMRSDTTQSMGIRLLLTDVDGTLTDGGMYYTAQGDTMKRFNARDGMGLQLLQRAGIKVGIVTSETTGIVQSRAEKIGVDFLAQGVRDTGKVEAAREICDGMGIPMSQMAYIGDDVNCLDLLRAAGLAACPSDAATEVKMLPGIRVMTRAGGQGCVRELCDWILRDGR